MANAIQRCQKCERVRPDIHTISRCGHTVCKVCLPSTEQTTPRGPRREVISNPELSIYRHAKYFPPEENEDFQRSSEPVPMEPTYPNPGDCPVCQQRILCKNTSVNTHLVTFRDFDWIKQVQDKLDPRTCVECPDGQVQNGEYRCLKCDRVLCKKCQHVHRQDGGHLPISLDDIAKRKLSFCINLNRGFDPQYCARHTNQELSDFCKNCSKPVCRLCLQFHEEEGHVTILLVDGLREMQKYVTDSLDAVHRYKEMLNVEKDKFQRDEISKDIAALKKLPEEIAACLKSDIDAAIEKLSQIMKSTMNQESEDNTVRAADEIANLNALEKTHEIMHRAKEKNVCSDEERIIRLYCFLKSNEIFVEGARRCLGRLQKDSASQLPNPVVIYSDPVKQLKNIAERHLYVVSKKRVKGVHHHSTRSHSADTGDGAQPKLVSGTIWPAEADGHVQIVVADANKRVIAFEFSASTGITLKWKKTQESSATLRSLKELKAAWINQDGRTATAVDVDGNVCEIGMETGERRGSVISTKKKPEKAKVAYCQGDTDLPAEHGYNLPKFLEKKGVIPHQVIGFGKQDTFVVSGMHTASNKPLVLVSRGGDVDLVKIWPENSRPSRTWIDHEGFIYCVNTDGNSITRYSPDGRFDREVLCAFDQLSRPVDVAVDRQFMYVTEEEGNIKIFERVPSEVAPISESIDI